MKRPATTSNLAYAVCILMFANICILYFIMTWARHIEALILAPTPATMAQDAPESSVADERGGDGQLGQPQPMPVKPTASESQINTRLMRVTAYCPCAKCCGTWADGVTAAGHSVAANGGHFVAADRSLPFGTMVVVPGYAKDQPVPVWDRGGAILGSRLDVYFPTHQAALEWGVQWLEVEIQR